METLEKAIIATSLMNVIFHQYEAGELGKHGELIRARSAKFLRQRSKSNKDMYLKAVYKTNDAWQKAINEFMKTSVEAKSVIARIQEYFSDELQKFAKISDQHIDGFMRVSTENAEAEHNSTKVVEFILQEVGIEVKRSLFAGRKAIIKGNMILENKTVKEGF